MPSWENLDDFFNPADFGVTARIRQVSGATRMVNGIFDAPYLNAELGEYELDTNNPRFTCKASDVVGIKRADMITIPGQGLFDILHDPEGDGTGQAILRLALAGG